MRRDFLAVDPGPPFFLRLEQISTAAIATGRGPIGKVAARGQVTATGIGRREARPLEFNRLYLTVIFSVNLQSLLFFFFQNTFFLSLQATKYNLLYNLNNSLKIDTYDISINVKLRNNLDTIRCC